MSTTLERTEAQREAARINGAKSRGPITREGKAIFSQNARKHGLAARKIVLEDEDQAEYDALLAGYRESFSPADRAEDDLVRMLALYQFRLGRAISVAVASTNLETLKQDAVVTEAFERTPATSSLPTWPTAIAPAKAKRATGMRTTSRAYTTAR